MASQVGPLDSDTHLGHTRFSQIYPITKNKHGEITAMSDEFHGTEDMKAKISAFEQAEMYTRKRRVSDTLLQSMYDFCKLSYVLNKK